MQNTPDQRRAFFTKVFTENLWDSRESASGQGSEKWICRNLVAEMPEMFRALNVQSILDVPCGDFNWMQDVINQSGIAYIGGDIVPDLILRNTQAYGAKAVSFKEIDIVEDDLPRVDMIFVRDLFIHMSLDLISKALANIARSEAKYLMLTHDSCETRYPPEGNIELHEGNAEMMPDGVSFQYRPLNMTVAPFHLPQPIYMIFEGFELWDGFKTMSVWTIEQLREALGADLQRATLGTERPD